MVHRRFVVGLSVLALGVSAVYAAPTGPVQRLHQETPGLVTDPSAHSLANSGDINSTGFEAPDGWDLGFSICGAPFGFGVTCFYPVTNVCIPKNHVASQNCCPDDPNEVNGWSMSPSGRHCTYPLITNIHPSTLKGPSIQHMRFEYDPAGGVPPGCNGFGSACRQRAITSQDSPPGLPEVSKSVWKYDIAISGTLGSSMLQVNGEDTGAGSINLTTYIYWYYLGGLYIYDFQASGFVFGGYWSGFSPDYAQFEIIFNPCNDEITYLYGGVVVHEEVYGFTHPSGDPGDLRPPTTDTAFYTTDHFGEIFDMDNHFVTDTPCPDACCDGNTGLCVEGLTSDECLASSDQATYTENVACAKAPCVRHTGACCDHNGGAGGPGPDGACTNGTYPEDCDGNNLTWHKGELCADIVCLEALGSCCNLLDGTCTGGRVQAECLSENPAQRVWEKGGDCLTMVCSAVLGACCDEDTFGGCSQTTQAGCAALKKGVWYKLTDCEDIECLHNAIPTVSEWGIVVLTLLLLTGAKVYFGRRQAIA